MCKDTLLFETLYDACCQLEGDNDSFANVQAALNAEPLERGKKKILRKACRKLANWYGDRYPKTAPEREDGKTSGKVNRAVTLNVVFGEGNYRFAEPYVPSVFRKYLLKETPYRRWDVSNFLLHMGVAFLLPPEKVNELLLHYGFLPLHSKNIHHVAIFTILNGALNREDRATYNPFPDLTRVYLKARKIVRGYAAVEEDGENPAGFARREDSTRFIKNSVMVPSLTEERFLAYVSRHAWIYSMRHTRLLREHKRMANLFAVLYMDAPEGEEDGKANRETAYSFYAFLCRFGKYLERKRFLANLYNYIAQTGCHPTREAMLLLWTHSFCFLALPTVVCTRDWSKLRPFHTKPEFRDEPLYPFAEWFDGKTSILRVQDYLADPQNRAAPLNGYLDRRTSLRSFRGSELVSFLNARLQDYEWRQLDANIPFDGALLKLRPLTITLDDSGGVVEAAYNGRSLRKTAPVIDNVPAPLVMIHQVLGDLGCDSRCQLYCDLYELI